MKRTKKELLQDLENMTLEKDIQYDRAENYKIEIDELEEENAELQEKAETLHTLIDLIDCLYIATIRFNAGIETERETIDAITQKILDMRETTI